jgi:DNA helicase II / ATP-dependent DNA helicase PcrA
MVVCYAPCMASRGRPSGDLYLYERQRQAIEHRRGPLLVLAGAGTGKTTVLTRRVARLIQQQQARADEILALTYADNAAKEMGERVRTELKGADISGLQATTFHAYCNHLLIRSGKQFGVLDDRDLWIYLRKRIRDLHLNYFVRAANVGQFLDDLLDFMRRCQDELVGPEKYADYVRRLERRELPIPRVTRSKDRGSLEEEEVLERCREISRVFSTVEQLLADGNLGTFGHMITRAYQLLKQDSALLASARARARFILVDEFQDANFAQVKILHLLAGEERNVFAVGDPDQAIYRFRGASSAAFGLFLRHFRGAKLLSLEKNQRSTAPILKCAFTLINRNLPVFPWAEDGSMSYQRSPLESARDEKAVARAAHDGGGELLRVPVESVIWRDRSLEATDLVGSLRQKQRQLRCRWSDFAILYRTHLHRDDIVKELSARNIPFSIENMDVLDTPEVRDLLACLGAVVSPGDGASLFRVAALPRFSVDPGKLRSAMRAAGKDSTLASVFPEIENGSMVLSALDEAAAEIQRVQARSRQALEIIIRRFSLDRSSPPIGAMLQFVSAWEAKPTTNTGEIGELLDYLEYFREARGVVAMTWPADNAVRLMTAHAAKGLEFDHVYIIRANSGSFPCQYHEPLVEFPRELRDPNSVAEEEGKALHEQEERRLFYVAMTRARDSLSIYAKQGTGTDSTPAGFLRDLLKDSTVRPYLKRRPAKPFQVDLFAEEEMSVISPSNTAKWLALDPGVDLNAKLSATAVEAYELCPLQFKLEREWRIPREIPAAMQYGAAMHRVLRTYYDAMRFGRDISDEEVVQLFRTDLAESAVQDRYQHELYEKQGVEQLRGFIALARQRPSPEVLHTEQWFSMRIGEATVNGRVDRMDQISPGRVAIVDYKTGKPRSQDDADESLQLSIYALAARAIWGLKADRLMFYNLEDNSCVSSTRSDSQLEEARAKVEEVAERIAAAKFPAKPGFHCAMCSYRNLCPATEKNLPMAPIAKKAAGRPH